MFLSKDHSKLIHGHKYVRTGEEALAVSLCLCFGSLNGKIETSGHFFQAIKSFILSSTLLREILLASELP